VRAFASSILLLAVAAIGVVPRGEAAEPAAGEASSAAAPALINVAIMDGMFRGVPPGLIKAGGNQFGSLFKDIVGLPGAVETESDHDALAKKLSQGKVHLGVFHGFEWAWVKQNHPNLAVVAITVPTALPRASIVVNAKNAAPGPQALMGANVEIPFNMKAHGIVYIEHLEKTLPAGSIKPSLTEDSSYEELLDEVGKGKAKAALVDSANLAAYQAGFPGKATKIKVLCESEQMPQTVLVYNTKTMPEDTVKQIRNGLVSAHKNAKGSAFLFLWNLKGFEAPNAAFDALVAKCLKQYPAPKK
jgi:ABC-type phosphate/phosphonate transport system substrate-binding protein